jgi:hypothetical protein
MVSAPPIEFRCVDARSRNGDQECVSRAFRVESDPLRVSFKTIPFFRDWGSMRVEFDATWEESRITRDVAGRFRGVLGP